MDARLETVQLNLLAFYLNVTMERGQICSQKLDSSTELTNRSGCSNVDTLHIFGKAIGFVDP